MDSSSKITIPVSELLRITDELRTDGAKSVMLKIVEAQDELPKALIITSDSVANQLGDIDYGEIEEIK